MARIGYSTTRDPYGAGGTTNGEGTFLQNFFATNLTTWTVGSLQSFNSGNEERNYFVCTQGSDEILVVIPNGSQSSYAEGVLFDYRTSNDNIGNGALGFAFADGGGYAARFIAGDDPSTDASFWPAQSTTVKTVDHYNSSASTLTLYLIENNSHAELVFFTASTNTNIYPAMWGYSANAYDTSRTPLGSTPPYTWKTKGVFGLDPLTTTTNGVPNVSRTYSVLFASELSAPYETNDDPIFFDAQDPIEDTIQPVDGEYVARRMARSVLIAQTGEDYGQFINYDRAWMREMPDTSTTYAGILEGDVADEEFIHSSRGYLLPWDTTLGTIATPP